MKYIFTFTAEELIVMLSVSGFDEEAKSLLDSTSISTGTKELETLFNATVAQLKIKGFWSKEKERNGLNPLADELISFLEMYVNSRFLIRATNEETKTMLVLQYIDFDRWIYHLIEDNQIHHFSIVIETEIHQYLKEYYHFNKPGRLMPDMAFSLTDRQFDLLKNPQNISKIKMELDGSDQEEAAFSLFHQDLVAKGFEMDNIAVFYISNKKELLLENIGFLFLSNHGIWLTEYESASSRPVKVSLVTQQEWEHYLENIYAFTANLINERVVLNKK